MLSSKDITYSSDYGKTIADLDREKLRKCCGTAQGRMRQVAFMQARRVRISIAIAA